MFSVVKGLGGIIFSKLKKINPQLLMRFSSDKKKFFTQSSNRFIKGKDWLCLFDATGTSEFDAQYIYHVAWATRTVAKIKPVKHIDFSSSLYFCTNVSAIVPTEFYDYRPAQIKLDQLTCGAADLTNLPFIDNSLDCVSCMHVIEHIGLGRYGDPIDYNGDIKAINELKRVVKVGGDLLFVVPIGGVPQIQYNAHRIYSFAQLQGYFSEFTILEHALIKDNKDFVINPDIKEYEEQQMGCICLWVRKNETI